MQSYINDNVKWGKDFAIGNKKEVKLQIGGKQLLVEKQKEEDSNYTYIQFDFKKHVTAAVGVHSRTWILSRTGNAGQKW